MLSGATQPPSRSRDDEEDDDGDDDDCTVAVSESKQHADSTY